MLLNATYLGGVRISSLFIPPWPYLLLGKKNYRLTYFPSVATSIIELTVVSLAIELAVLLPKKIIHTKFIHSHLICVIFFAGDKS
jgi:hypothetical protein